MSKKIAIVGVGGIGGVTGAYLSRAGEDVTLVDQWPANVDTINEKGLTLTALEEEFTVHPRALHLSDLASVKEQFDVAIVSVKSYDTPWIVRFMEPYLAPGGYFVSAQNSINEETVASIAGWSRIVGCVVTLGAGMYEPGHAMQTSPRARLAFKLGEPSGMITPRVTEIAEILGAVGATKTTTNLWGERWSKLAINCMSNAVAGMAGLKSAELREIPEVRRLSIRIAAELVQVGAASGVSIEPIGGIPAQMFVDALAEGGALEEVEGLMIEGGKEIGVGRPSLAQDIMKSRRTEVEHLNGYVARKGAEVGIQTPVNEAVVSVTKRVESGELEPSMDNLALVG